MGSGKVYKMRKTVTFHGGCIGCTQQLEQPAGVAFCFGCRYFDADWRLPDLSNEGEEEKAVKHKVRTLILGRLLYSTTGSSIKSFLLRGRSVSVQLIVSVNEKKNQ